MGRLTGRDIRYGTWDLGIGTWQIVLVLVIVIVIVIVIGSRSSRRGAESAEAILDADERGFRRQADIHRIISFSYPVVCLGTCSLVLVLGD